MRGRKTKGPLASFANGPSFCAGVTPRDCSLLDEVLELLERRRANLPRRGLGGEHALDLGERVDALVRRLRLDVANLQLEQVRDHELPRAALAELALHEVGETREHARHVLLRDAGLLRQLADDLRLRHTL